MACVKVELARQNRKAGASLLAMNNTRYAGGQSSATGNSMCHALLYHI